MNIYLETYGCTANKSDANLVKYLLKKDYHEIVNEIDDANVIIILTCTVIGTTEQRMLSRLREFKKTGKRVIVSGCMASVQSDLIKSIIPDVDIIPPQYSYHITDVLDNKNISFEKKNKTIFSKYYEDITAPISIAEGCMFSCSYCITSIARGNLRSYPVNEIIQDVFSALKQGCKEIQLTAQDTSSYGFDSGNNLGYLLNSICQIKGKYRIRVGMMNPYTIKKNIDSIMHAFTDTKIYNFLHIPVQSGDNEILKKMERKYTIDDFLNIIKGFRKNLSDLTVSTDIIIGFPTETEEQFINTLDIIKKVKPDITNITKYSTRPLTKAKIMKGKVRTDLIKERSRTLTNLCKKISMEKNSSYIGKKCSVLIIKKGKNKSFIGRTDNYKPVVIKEKLNIGRFYPIIVTRSKPTHLFGMLI